MCGIFGYFNRKGTTFPHEILQRMGNSIRHRGPDDQGIASSAGWALGNQRLSIIDLAGGHQPFISDDGLITVIQNGEIFNHIELAVELAKDGYPCRTHSDTEVLLRLYERDGMDFLSRLNGMFAIAIHDERTGTFHLARDRIGVKPLYIMDDGEELLFASEIKAILAAGRTPPMHTEALHHFLAFNYVPPPLTMYQGIQHLMPGHCLSINRDGTKKWQWWDLAEIHPEHHRTETDWIEEFNTILDDAVRLRLRADVPFGAFLSGGVDSSTIVGLMARHMDEPTRTFCIGFDDPRYDESLFAQEAATRFGCHHTMERVAPNMLDLWPLAIHHCDQPHGDISFLPTYRVAQLAAKQVKVVLTGDGGDELFAGYDKYRDFFAKPAAWEHASTAFQKSYFSSISLFSDQARDLLYTPLMRNQIKGMDSFDIAKKHFDAVPHQDRINQALYLDMQLLLSGNNLVKPDRMGMAVSLEARTPFLDYRMMELAFRMPGNLKLKNGETKYLYKKAVAPLIGERLAYRKKQMFTVPVGNWFKTTLYDYCHDLLNSSPIMDRYIQKSEALRMLESHRTGSANHTREIRALLAVCHWYQRNASLNI